MLSQNLSLKVQIPMDMVILLWMNMFVNNRENLQLKPALKKILKSRTLRHSGLSVRNEEAMCVFRVQFLPENYKLNRATERDLT